MWPGLVGKGEGSEPAIDLDTMLKLTAGARVDGVGFDGVDLFLADPHISIDADPDEIKALADKVAAYGLEIGSCVAPVWPASGGGSAMGGNHERKAFLDQVRKACAIGRQLRDLGIRTNGVIRIDSADRSPQTWARDPAGSSKAIARTFTEASLIAESFGERLAIEGEICWGGMHSWRYTVELLEAVGRPRWLGFQADMAHTMLFAMGHNAPEHALMAEKDAYKGSTELDAALTQVANALRPWTIDFHVAQNDGSVKGMGSHDKTGRHCLPKDPNGLLDIAAHAGLWLRDEDGDLTKACRHICWDGCMFPNEVLLRQDTWNDILAAMISVRKGSWLAGMMLPAHP